MLTDGRVHTDCAQCTCVECVKGTVLWQPHHMMLIVNSSIKWKKGECTHTQMHTHTQTHSRTPILMSDEINGNQ